MGDLVTGEAVVLDLRVAQLASRAVAFAIDVAVQFGLLVLLFLVAPIDLDNALQDAVALTLLIAVMIGFPTAMETATRGRSLGKLAMGLRVVRDDGGAIRFRHALVRSLTGFIVDFWVLGLAGAIALFVSLFSPQGKRVGDYLAGTVVIHTRVPSQEVELATMPPQLAQWASGLDLSQLPEELVLAVRQYLSRYHELNEQARWDLGSRLSDDVGAAIRSPRVEQTHPHPYLSAVLAERRRRAAA
ncbi:RDD family protein [Lentzea sp. NEAU-D7]|uniref:RDD family protein n=1 Tax=Lentzea sp. NEAU-D7 TaxID=2994667 RepID=UPI00224B02FF|nr:RDD family protein [Lentzea sp. NEAU-D7]MCX2947618.1 RDD family protein [Lentzea sp. NEAU-D7]